MSTTPDPTAVETVMRVLEGMSIGIGFRDESGDDAFAEGTLDTATRRDVAREVVAALDLTEETEAEWCSEANPYWRCDVWDHYHYVPCRNSCRTSGPHERHECVNGHMSDFDGDDRQPGTSRRLVTPWTEAGK